MATRRRKESTCMGMNMQINKIIQSMACIGSTIEHDVILKNH